MGKSFKGISISIIAEGAETLVGERYVLRIIIGVFIRFPEIRVEAIRVIRPNDLGLLGR